MRVFYATFDEVPSLKGASVHVLAACRHIPREHELHLFTLGDIALPQSPRFVHRPQALSEPNYLRRGLAFRQRVESALSALRPEVVHFRTPWEGLAAVRSGLPCVYEVNGLPSVELPQTWQDLPASALAIFHRWEAECLAAARAVVCPSPRIRDFLVTTFGEELVNKIQVLPNGYDPVRPSGPRSPSPRLRMVYLGTLHPWQGVSWMLRGLAALRGRCTLDLYAPLHRAFTEHLERRIRRYGLADFVRLHPPLHRGRLARLLPDYDVGLAPLLKDDRNTRQGCCPIKILDYLAHGLPVVASDLFVVRQLVSDEKNGLLFAPNDLDALVGALSRLADNPALRSRLAAAVPSSLAGVPTWDDHSMELCRLYERISSSARAALPGRPPAPAPPKTAPLSSVAP